MEVEPIKVLFLDIDGVVNCATTTQRHRGFIGIDPYMAFLVGKLVMETGVKVVLSSSWRNSPDGIEEVESQVVKLFDMTETLGRPVGTSIEYCERGREIKEWLDRHPQVVRYAILDDNNDMLPEQQPNFFKTSWLTGITPEICAEVKEHLLKT
jgi:hypothetical protein